MYLQARHRAAGRTLVRSPGLMIESGIHHVVLAEGKGIRSMVSLLDVAPTLVD